MHTRVVVAGAGDGAVAVVVVAAAVGVVMILSENKVSGAFISLVLLFVLPQEARAMTDDRGRARDREEELRGVRGLIGGCVGGS